MSSLLLDPPPRRRPEIRTERTRLEERACDCCDGEAHVTVMASDGAWIDIPCPSCAPNDAPGG
ncbi:MAG: hypothetical protein QNJ98_08675 [Planctomycetota bacterium]|nr:hypothetical protein [Planctomycetota bacterium]